MSLVYLFLFIQMTSDSPAETDCPLEQRLVADDPVLQVHLISKAVVSHFEEEPECKVR